MTMVSRKIVSIEIECCTAADAMEMINKLNQSNVFSSYGNNSGSGKIKMHTAELGTEYSVPICQVEAFEKSNLKIEIQGNKVIHRIMSKL
jgi:hypothetical protein